MLMITTGITLIAFIALLRLLPELAKEMVMVGVFAFQIAFLVIPSHVLYALLRLKMQAQVMDLPVIVMLALVGIVIARPVRFTSIKITEKKKNNNNKNNRNHKIWRSSSQ